MTSQLCGAITNITFRSDHDLWITRMSQNGRYRCCCRNRHRTVCRCNRRIHLQSQVQPRCKTAFSWFPPQCKDHWNHLCDWCTFDYHAVHRFCHDLLHEPDSDRVFFNRNSRFLVCTFKLQSFFFMPLFGLNNGITPIIAYNYGASKQQNVWSKPSGSV